MSCKHPLKGFQIGLTDKGKPAYKIVPYRAKGVYKRSKSSDWSIDYDVGHSIASDYRYVSDFIEIPCGHCTECRLQYSRSWADRCMLEAQYHKYNYFVTLTYDNEHLNFVDGVNPDTGEHIKSATLVKKDVQDFIKRLRSHFNYVSEIATDKDKKELYSHIDNMKYFLAGEYGENSSRPHYHIIFFDLPLDDLYYWSRNQQGDMYYRSPLLEEKWHKGNVIVASVTWETCAYTARYCMKKQKGDASMIYTHLGILPEFTLMSRRPGIARQWYEDNKDKLYSSAFLNISTEKGGQRIYPSRYFDNLFDIDEPDQMKEIKEERRFFSENNEVGVSRLTSRDKVDRLRSEEIAKQKKLLALRRRLD